MGEARRRSKQGLSHSKNRDQTTNKGKSNQNFPSFPLSLEQRQEFIRLTIKLSWFGIGFLILLWVVVRFIGPAAGWWVPADL
mgnify:CR=1 FL=1